MAQKTITKLVDDLDGRSCELELTNKNADGLHQAFAHYVEAARKVSDSQTSVSGTSRGRDVGGRRTATDVDPRPSASGPRRRRLSCRHTAASRRRSSTSSKQQATDLQTRVGPAALAPRHLGTVVVRLFRGPSALLHVDLVYVAARPWAV